LVGGGIVIGLLAASALARVLSSILYGVSAHDPLTFIVVPLALTAIALLAAWMPARRASRVDPIIALREE
jgi:ABC-type antimicrobial peptide transport system permease subunit